MATTPASTRTINCEDCGQPYETRRANTKVCGICRLYRNVRYLGETYGHATRKCEICDGPYEPIERSDIFCGGCSPPRGHRGACTLCGRDEVDLLRADLTVCMVCARDPKRRKTLYKSLVKKVKARTEDARGTAAH